MQAYGAHQGQADRHDDPTVLDGVLRIPDTPIEVPLKMLDEE